MNRNAILFDMDGVLVDTSTSYDEAIKSTVRQFDGGDVSFADIFHYRKQGGYNNDWDLTERLLQDRGITLPYEKIKAAFQSIYLGRDDGLITTETWLLNNDTLHSLFGNAPLGIVTGRPKYEAEFTLRRANAKKYFTALVTLDDVKKLKPHPEGLLLAMDLLRCTSALYLGDSVDDLHAARSAGITFIGIIPVNHQNKDELRSVFIEHDVETVFEDVNQIKDFINA